VEPDDHEAALAELTRRLAVLEADRRKQSPFLDRIVSRLGEAELAVGILMLVFTPFDALSSALGTVGAATWAYDKFIKQPRETRREIERSRQIDLLRSELDRLTRR
jgi:hypothetical protein